MVGLYRCPRCGSAGSIEFDMCQVCLYDYSKREEADFIAGGQAFFERSLREQPVYAGESDDHRVMVEA